MLSPCCNTPLRYHYDEWTEPHGEPCRDEHWTCGCGEEYTDEEIRAYAAIEELEVVG